MKKHNRISCFILIAIFLGSCTGFQNNKDLDNIQSKAEYQAIPAGIDPVYADGDVNAIIEIPAGTLEKWEMDKSSGQILRDSLDGKPRTVNYLGYPANYGFIPKTLLDKESGGDGDPLDIIILGPPLERGSIARCKIVGVLYLLDRGEQDDKLIAVSTDSPMYGVNNLAELNGKYNAITEILQLWFTNYKGSGKMESRGFGDKHEAHRILLAAIEEYNSSK